jgi:hypothetical protein
MRAAATASFLPLGSCGQNSAKIPVGRAWHTRRVPSSERLRARRRALSWLLAAAAVIAGALFALWRGSQGTASDPPLLEPLSVVPAGPAFVLTVDVARLRGSALGRELIGKELAQLAPAMTGAAGEHCESTLSSDIDRLAVAVPANEPQAPATFGVIAAGRFQKDPALRCAAGSSGNLEGTVRSTIGAFDTLRDPKTTREVAARDGLLVQSDGPYFRALLDRAEQRQPKTTEAEDARDRLHAELRRVVGQNAPIVASLVLPPGWLARMLAEPSAEASPLAEIRAAALRVEVASDFTLAGTIRCDRDDACARLEHFLSALKNDLGALNAAGALSLLSKLSLARRGAALDFSGTFGAVDIDQLNSVAMTSAASSPSPAPSPAPASLAPSSLRVAPPPSPPPAKSVPALRPSSSP